MESKVSIDFAEHSANFFVDRSDYNSVRVLLLYWRGGDLDVRDELKALRRLFEVDLNFRVASYPLIGDENKQQGKLRQEIANFIADFALEKRSLAIIYYTGHCREVDGKAQWTAERQGGPTLIWSDIQSSCFDAVGDVLLILDCCHATLLKKGHKIDGRFEVLTACAKGLETPLPGEGSFTWALLKVFSGEVLKQGTTVKKLRGLIDDHTRETPFWDSIGNDSVTSIFVKRLEPPSDPRFKRKPASYLLIRASLSEDLDGIQISNWLKTNAPKTVSAVTIEAVVMKARHLQKNLDHNAFPQGSVLRKLSQVAQSEILKHLQSLDTRMVTAARDAQNPLVDGDDEAISKTLSDIQSGADAVKASIETPLLLGFGREFINQAIDNDEALYFDALESISLHDRITDVGKQPTISLEILRKDIRFLSSTERFVKGKMNDRDVLIEFFDYVPDEHGNPYFGTIEQLEKMSELLVSDKDLGFHILPSVGYVHEDVRTRFGVVFQLGPKQNATRMPPVTLQSLYANCRRMSLSRRVEMAHAIVTAVENLHRVEWIHKEIRSENICFLTSSKDQNGATEDDLAIDFSSPWLFGFEYARAIAAGTKREEDYSMSRNLYRHPQRWGQPQVDFMRSHDVYSLGVVLMEIAHWKQIDGIVKINGRTVHEILKTDGRIKSFIFREEMLKILERNLTHQIGDIFTETISACFEFEERAVAMDKYQMQRLFQNSILGRIQKMVGRV